MCVEGFTANEGTVVGKCTRVCCIVCGFSFTRAYWNGKVKEYAVQPLTTMGGGSNEKETNVETHTAELRIQLNKTFAWSLDGTGCNMRNVMDVMSKAVEDWVATMGGKVVTWGAGTYNAYERLGRALQVDKSAPAVPTTHDATRLLEQAVAALSDASVARDSPLHVLIEKLMARVVPGAPVIGERPYDLVKRAADKTVAEGAHYRVDRESMMHREIERLNAFVEPLAKPPKPLLLAQRLAAFVAERAAMEAAARDWFEKAVNSLPTATSGWDTSMMFRLVRAAVLGRRKVCYQFGTTDSAYWAEGADVPRAYLDAGFSVMFEPNVICQGTHTAGDGSYGAILVVKF